MKIQKRHNGDVTILAIQGRVTIGEGDVALRQEMHATLDGGARKILLDMSGVSTIDSSGVGEVVSSFTGVANRGGKLKLLNLPPKVVDILTITQLITVFEVFEDEAAAVASF